MVTCYKTNTSGEIIEAIEFNDARDVNQWFRDNYLLTDRKIVILSDGSYAFADAVDWEAENNNRGALELAEAKEAKKAEMKMKRDAGEVMPLLYNGHLYDFDEKSRERLDRKRQEIEDKGGTGTIPWTLADNTETTIGLQDFIAINSAATERAEMLHFKYRKLRQKIDDATTIEEVARVKWEDSDV